VVGDEVVDDDAPVAVVTGASRGLGAGLVERLLDLGWRVACCARSAPSFPDAPVGRLLTAAVDVTDAGAVEGYADAVETRFGPVTLWVNNAGVLGPIGPARDADPAEVHRALAINVGGAFVGSAAFARRARRWPPGRRVLVNIGSGAGTSVYPGWSVYGPTKAAVDHLSRHLAAEEPDLVVASVAPGVVDTDMQREIRASDEARFPAIERFRDLQRTGAYNSPTWIADHLVALVDGMWVPDGVVARVPDEPRPAPR
jgi:hypothetical protein